MTAATCSLPTDNALAAPAERPESDVVIYDGRCKMCTTQVQRLPWLDCQNKLSYLSLHDPEVARRWPDLPFDRMMTEMVVVDREGNRHWGPEAFRFLSRRLRRLWWAAPILNFPGSMILWRPLYRWVARNRYRFSGGAGCDEGGTCELHR